jgi:hypothetical protein
MFKVLLLPTAAAVMALFLLSSNTLASDQRDFAEQSCKDVMRLSGGDRDIALAFAHGYRLGKKGTTRYEIEALAQITDRFIDYCLDHPSENALQSFEKVAE